MSRRWSTIAIILLAMAVVLGGVAGCEQSARTRPTSTPETGGGETSPTGVPTSGEVAPTSGPTKVSVVTPVAGETPTEEAGGETPADVEPTETTAAEPTSEPVATEAPAPAPGVVTTHTVRQGETLSSIARLYGTTWQAIAKANDLVNPNQIYVGQKLKIPSGSPGSSGGTTPGCRYRHTVKRGEWVWQIARNYGVSPYDILAANGLTIKSANTIYPGTVLCIP